MKGGIGPSTRLACAVVAVVACAVAGEWQTRHAELLVDAEQFESIDPELSFRQGTPIKDRTWVAVVPEYEWETAVHFYTALADVRTITGQYHLYYACANDTLFFNPIYVCLAVSTDGETFTKPLLDILPFEASNGTTLNTNRVWQTVSNMFLGNVIVTNRVNASSSASQVVMVYEGEDPFRSMHIAVSNDGIHFSNASQPYLSGLAEGFADTQTAIVELGEDVGPVNASTGTRQGGGFVVYGRLDEGLPGGYCGLAYASLRRVMAAPAAAPRGPASSFAQGPYSNATQVIQPLMGLDPLACFDVYNPAPLSVPSALLSLPSFFWHISPNQSGAPTSRAADNDGVMDIRLWSSRDGLEFSPVSREAFLSRGVGGRDPSSGLYNASGSDRDAGFVFFTAQGLIDPSPPGTADFELSAHVHLLYWGSQTTHAGGGAYLFGLWPGAFSGVLRARLRREGFVSLSTGMDVAAGGGEARTRPMTVPSLAEACGAGYRATEMRLNYAAEVGGNVTVALLDATGEELPGFGYADSLVLRNNEIRGIVAWNAASGAHADWSGLAGQQVSMALRVANAEVFAWKLACVPSNASQGD